jgi:hypothetical protein
MKVLIVLTVLCMASCNVSAVTYVWDLLKPALTSDEVLTLITSRDAIYPTYASIPDTKFACSNYKQPGFYADMDTQCQVFHRCDQAGNQTSYICVNSTVFNQITLICDAWFNVECARSGEFVDFANSRLYTDKPLFDTPPADYVAPSQKPKKSSVVSVSVSSKTIVAKVPKAAKAAATTTAAPEETSAADAGDAGDSGASASGSAEASSSSE